MPERRPRRADPGEPDLGLVVVNYRTASEAARAVEAAVASAGRLSVDALIVDNASDEARAAELERASGARVLCNRGNWGFGAAANLGAWAVGGRHILFLNPDVTPVGEAVAELVSRLDEAPAQVAMLGGRLLNRDGSLQHSCRTFYDLTTIVARRTPLGRLPPLSAHERRHLYADWDHASPRDVDWLIGACLCVRRSFFEETGGFDERFFMYFEDVDLCYRAHLRGRSVRYQPSAVFVHGHRRASAGPWPSHAKLRHLASMLRFYRKWGLQAGSRRPAPRSAPPRRRVLIVAPTIPGPLALRIGSFAAGLGEGVAVEMLVRDQLGAGRVRQLLRLGLRALGARADAALLFDVGVGSLVALAGLKLGCGARAVIDTGDPYRELHRRAGHSSGLALVLRGLVEWLVLALSDAISARGRGLADALRASGRRAVAFIPDGVDVERVAALDGRDVRKGLGLDGQLVVATLGNFLIDERYGVTYAWDLVEALARLRGQPVAGLVIGSGPGLAWLERRAEELGVRERVTFTGFLPFEEFVRHLKAADVCLSTQSDDALGRARTTGKLPLYMATGRYVLASRVGGAIDALPPEMLVPYSGELDRGYPERLALRLAELVAHPERLRLGEGLVAVARREFAYERLLPRMRKLLELG